MAQGMRERRKAYGVRRKAYGKGKEARKQERGARFKVYDYQL